MFSLSLPSLLLSPSHLQLLWVFLLPQFEAKLLGRVLQPADLLCGLGERLLQLVQLLLFLLLQLLLDVLLLLPQELPQTAELGGDQLLQVSRSLLEQKESKQSDALDMQNFVYNHNNRKEMMYDYDCRISQLQQETTDPCSSFPSQTTTRFNFKNLYTH